MKSRALLIAASLLANAALAFVVIQRHPSWESALPWSRSSADAASASTRNASEEKAKGAKLDPGTWMTLSNGDVGAVLARLRAEGFPISVQRAIVGELIAEKYADRHRALAKLIDSQPWWTVNPGSGLSAKIIAERQKLMRDEKEEVDNLMGADSSHTPYSVARQVQQYGAVPEAKLTELDRINRDYAELINEIRSNAQGIFLPEDREKIAFLEKEKRADIEKLLTPDELLEYDLRSSPSANWLRNQLVAFKPSEDEFRSLFKLLQPIDSQYGSGNLELLTPEQRRAREEAIGKARSQAKDVLTPDRYAEFELKTDPNYVRTSALVSRLSLPETATSEILAVQKDISKRAQAFYANATVPADERSAQLKALASEAVLRLTPTLGQDGLNAYRQSGGAWITQLERPPALPTKPGPAPKK